MRPSSISIRQWIKYNYYFVLQHFLGVKYSEKHLKQKKEKLFQSVLKTNQLKGRGETLKVRECNSIEEFLSNKKELLNEPLIFKGAAAEWPAVKNWSKEYFIEYFANSKVELVGNVGLADKKNQNKFIETNFKEFINELSKDKANYLRFSRIIDDNPELRSDMDVDWLRNFKSGVSWGDNLYMFMGEAGSSTSMHNALIQSLFIQINGLKKWTLYAPNERFFLDPVAARMPYFYTDANPNNPNDKRYPLLSYAKKYEIVLEGGDILYFPSYYWHYVENLTANIGVTYKFTNIPFAFKLSKVMTSLYFLATKPTLLRSFYHNFTKNKDYIFDKH